MGSMTDLPGSVAGEVVFSCTYHHESNQSTVGCPIPPNSTRVVECWTSGTLAGLDGVWGLSNGLRGL